MALRHDFPRHETAKVKVEIKQMVRRVRANLEKAGVDPGMGSSKPCIIAIHWDGKRATAKEGRE